MTKILIIDEDKELCQLLQQYLLMEGFDLECAHDGEEGLSLAQKNHYAAFILDVMLPNKNGFEVLKAIRATLDTPALMLTARSEEIDKIIGLEIGADDYLAKPCNPRELVARLKAILRRSQNQSSENHQKPIIEVGDIQIDMPKRKASIKGKTLEITNAEFNILELLLRTPGQAYSKEELTEHALGRKYAAFDRSIDVHISNLRTKIGNNSDGSAKIKTVRGFGYLFDGK